MREGQTTLRDETRQAWLGRLDSLGILLSGICIVHCLALPLLLAVLPVSLVALGFGWRRHGDARVLWLGGAGLFLLAFATYGYRLFGLPEDWERAISIVGGLIHAAGHLLNFRRTRALHDHSAHAGHAH